MRSRTELRDDTVERVSFVGKRLARGRDGTVCVRTQTKFSPTIGQK